LAYLERAILWGAHLEGADLIDAHLEDTDLSDAEGLNPAGELDRPDGTAPLVPPLILRGFGLKVGPTTPRSFEGRIRELVDGHATLLAVADALLLARACLAEQLGRLQKRLVSLARDDARARLLMSTPDVGVLVALTYVAAIDDPGRFKSSKARGDEVQQLGGAVDELFRELERQASGASS